MKMKILAATMVLFSAQSFAGVPEFDAVGDDSANIFNDAIRDAVVESNVKGRANTKINMFSAFANENFSSTGSLDIDPCFEQDSYYAGPRNTNSFHWDIVLQMKPESDLDLNIRDCVLNGFSNGDIMTEATQTGRYRSGNGTLFFKASTNPTLTVEAISGPKHPESFSVILDSRSMPGLNIKAIKDVPYTSKALWEETIVIKMPEDGEQNDSGQGTKRLREGDTIRIWVNIPGRNANDIFYGQDNVSLEYVGERRTGLMAP